MCSMFTSFRRKELHPKADAQNRLFLLRTSSVRSGLRLRLVTPAIPSAKLPTPGKIRCEFFDDLGVARDLGTLADQFQCVPHRPVVPYSAIDDNDGSHGKFWQKRKKHIMLKALFLCPPFFSAPTEAPPLARGHVMRCLALAQACGDSGHTPIFLGANLSEALVKRIKGERIDVRTLKSSPYGKEDQQETIAAAQSLNAMIVVVDGHDFDAGTRPRSKMPTRCSLWDDYSHAASYDAQFVLNQNSVREGEYVYQAIRGHDSSPRIEVLSSAKRIGNFRSNREIKPNILSKFF